VSPQTKEKTRSVFWIEARPEEKEQEDKEGEEQREEQEEK
jgi:hypothetical protein